MTSVFESMQLNPISGGRWIAQHEAIGMIIGSSKADAIRRVQLKLAGKHDPREIPRLHLCKPCNKRAAIAGDMVASTEGIDVCLECADAIDAYIEASRKWKSRVKRNERKRNKRK